jgi:hypothetical protein
VVERILIGRIELLDPAERAFGFLRLPRFAKREAEVIERCDVIRRELERPAIALDRPR